MKRFTLAFALRVGAVVVISAVYVTGYVLGYLYWASKVPGV